MVGDLLDRPWTLAIIALLILVLFGSKKLPGAARSLGQSMRILKREVQGLHGDDQEAPAESGTSAPQFQQPQLTTTPAQGAQSAPGAPDGQQAQIDALQQQIRDLQRASAMDSPAPEPQHTQPS
jgi:sec-independent protein translocase protein TatA